MNKNLENIINDSSIINKGKNLHLLKENQDLFKNMGYFILPDFIDNIYKLSDELKKKKKRVFYISIISSSILLNSYRIYNFFNEIYSYLLK